MGYDMMHTRFSRPIAVLALVALAACGGPMASTTPAAPTNPITPTNGSSSALVGVGDSLTAGYQSGGFLGDPTATSSFSSYPGGAVPPGQENGFWSLLYQQLTGTPSLAMYNAATSPLPLIKAPGLGAQLVLNATTPPFLPIQAGCSTFNLQGYSSTAWAATRMSPSAPVTDLGIPGITMHEAVSMTGPLTGPPPGAPNDCSYPSNASDLTAGGLQSLVQGESELFYPVLGEYQGRVTSLTELNAAVALKPQLATVWLGANDLLKYIFSNKKSPITDSPTQLAADLTQIVKSLAGTGAKVLVADLPNVLTTPQFFPDAKLTADFTTVLVVLKVPAAVAPNYAAAMTAQVEGAYNINGGGYLTETGFLQTVKEAAAAIQANPAAPAFSAINLDAGSCGSGAAGSGAGTCYITPAFATAINALNTGYNQAIDTVAKSSGSNVALVPITATFSALAAPGANLNTVIPGAPSATLQFGGGLLSWDGLHPSNLGYAVIANAFIQAADTPTAGGGLGLSIPPLSVATLGTIASTDPYYPAVVNAGLGATVFPLP